MFSVGDCAQVGLLFFCDSTFVFVISSVYTLVRLIHLTGGEMGEQHMGCVWYTCTWTYSICDSEGTKPAPYGPLFWRGMTLGC